MKICILDGNKHGRIIEKIITELAPQDCIVELFTVLDKGSYCTNDMLVEGLVYALFNDVDIVNISLGLDYMTDTMKDIIDKLVAKGVKVCCASGNNRSVYPAMYEKTISVGACDEFGNPREYTVGGTYTVLEKDGYEIDGEKYFGTSYACAVYVGYLAWR